MKKNIFGMLLMLEGAFVLLALAVSLYYHFVCGEDDWQSLAITAGVCFAIGGLFKLAVRKGEAKHMMRADCFFIVSILWVVYSAVGMLPYILYLGTDPAGAFFEAMSGFTTTGATVLSGLDKMPHGILFWRSLTQWMGGLGIVVFSFALLPVYDLKNSNIFSAEVTGLSLDRLKPKIGSTARRLLVIYLFLTGACIFAFWLGPMNLFDAICHGFTTVATGGFSTHDKSIAFFDSAYIEWIAPVFMLFASINFSLFYYFSILRPMVLLRNEETSIFLAIVATSVLGFVLIFYYGPMPALPPGVVPPHGIDTLRTAWFHVASIISSTGFAGKYCDYVAWGTPFTMLTLIIMCIGACAGGTAGGIKVVRLIVCAKSIVKEFVLQLHPRAVRSIRVNGQVVDDMRVRRTLDFIIIYFMLIAIGIYVLSFYLIDMDTSVGSCITMLSNVGPGSGTTGPTSNFAAIPPAAKWIMSFYMLVGRLEIYTVLFLFMPSFWRERGR